MIPAPTSSLPLWGAALAAESARLLATTGHLAELVRWAYAPQSVRADRWPAWRLTLPDRITGRQVEFTARPAGCTLTLHERNERGVLELSGETIFAVRCDGRLGFAPKDAKAPIPSGLLETLRRIAVQQARSVAA